MKRFLRAFRLPARSRSELRGALEEELAFHMEAAAEEWQARGLSPEEAMERVRAEFGDLPATRAYCLEQDLIRTRQETRSMRFERFAQDLRYAIRTLGRSPGYSATVVATLAIGIAANAVIFSLVNPYFFRTLPYGDPDDLVQIGQVTESGWEWGRLSLAQIEDWSQRSPAILDWAAYYYSIGNVTGTEGPERIQYTIATDNLFQTLQSSALLGRTLEPGDGGPGGEDVVVLAHGLWERRYAGDTGVVGRTIPIDGVLHTVIGVMPPEFNFPFGDAYMWVPDRASAMSESRLNTAHIPVGRLAPGWSVEGARGDLLRVQRELSEIHPDVDGRFRGTTVQPIRQALNFAWEPLRVGSLILSLAVGLVLIIACVNVAGLTLARSRSRGREIAIRTAVGADGRRIVRQLLTESLLLAVVGGLLGTAVAFGATGILDSLLPPGLFKVGGATLDGRVMGITLLLTLGTPLVFGLAPALSLARADLAGALREGAQGSGTGKKAMRSRRFLVVTEVALAVVLISGTTLMVRSFMEMRDLSLGYESERVLSMEITPPASEYESPEEVELYYARATEAVAVLPGVEAVGDVYPMVMNHEDLAVEYARPDALPPVVEGTWPRALQAWAGPGYFEAMGIALRSGRAFTDQDGPESAPVAVVSQGVADRLWPGGSAVGQTIVLGANEQREHTVVGVVGDVYQSGFSADGPDLHVYLPGSLGSRRRRFLVAGVTGGNPSSLVSSARQALLAVDPNLPVDFRPLEEVVAENDFPWRLGSIFLGLFGGVALLLAALGVYGVIAYSVAQRTREMGIRVAMGAGPDQIQRSVIAEGLKLAGVGIGIGVLLALALGQVAQAILFEVSPVDPVNLALVLGVFVGVAILASAVPAHRAARVQPAEVLRAD